MKDVIIEVNHLKKKYKLYSEKSHRFKEALNLFGKQYHSAFYAIDDISFDVYKGTTVGFIGQNGSGKSTLLKVLAGIIPASEGFVNVKGKISALLELGTGFNPELTGVENIYFNGMILGFTKEEIDSKKEAIIDFAEIGDFIHQPVKTYSSGMFVRLAFSVAINVDPEILIIDEALSVGDAYFQVKCINRMKKFKESGKTILFVSHDAAAVKTLCDEAILLDKGKIIDMGKPDKVFNYYNSLISLKEEERQSHNKDKLVKRSGNLDIEIIDVALHNGKGLTVENVISGENVIIEMTIKVNLDVEDPNFGILIRDRLGNDVFGINNSGLNLELGNLKKGCSYKVKYKLNMNVGPNIYSLTVAAHQGATHVENCYDWINNVVTFKVIPDNKVHFIGYSRLNSEFYIEKI